HGLDVIAVGKVGEIFSFRGITESIHTDSNRDGMDAILNIVKQRRGQILFANLVDFDMKFGHRNDPQGFARALMEFDSFLDELLPALASTDLLILTADHGNDPITPSTDHSREYVPLLVYHPHESPGAPLGVRRTFADVAATIAEAFALQMPSTGTSFLKEVMNL
ncbi:MAG TPA: phosphopentomutase, partial [Armatimonadetes bacterium]|nr:phosphopentomutase [Armatimonadota bacterium]